MLKRSNRCALAVLCVSLVWGGAGVARAQESQRVYLSGTDADHTVEWDFSCSAGKDANTWVKLGVPSNWDAQGYGVPTYDRPGRGQTNPHEVGKYRHTFTAPAELGGKTVFLVFEGVMTDTTAMLNGQPVGPVHQGSFYRFKYDVTKLLKAGENTLEVTVDKESANASVNQAERQGDYWNFGGIFRPVYLEVRPEKHIERVAVNGRADGSFSVDVFAPAAAGATAVRAQLMSLDGTPVGTTFTGTLAEGKATLTTTVSSPKLWTAETPNLYVVQVSLLQGETVLHTLKQRFGFRTVEPRPDGLFINGQRVTLKGTNRHTFHPDLGRASSPRLSREDILLVKEMNNNAIRMSHYPPEEHFLDLCDELGLYVLDELAGWHQSYDTPTGKGLIEAMVKRDVNHPAIIFWDNGNEGGWNRENDDEFARWDPQGRAVLHPWEKFRGINTKHYPVYNQMKELASGPDLFFPTEFQHALFDGGGGAGLKDYWEVMRTGKAAAGGFIWALVDETLKRKDLGGKMDGNGNRAPDGLVGPYREREASYYTVKEVWSPVVVERSQGGDLTVENRYDFTNTKDCSFSWQLRKFGMEVKPGESVRQSLHTVVTEGAIPSPDIAPHGKGTLALNLPESSKEADALAVTAKDPSGRELWTWVYPLAPKTVVAGSEVTGAISAKESAETLDLMAGDLTVSFSKTTGQLVKASRGATVFPIANGPRPAFGEAKLQSLTHAAEGRSHVVKATYSGDLSSATWTLTPGGELKLAYSYSHTGPVDYLGVSFDLPENTVKAMTWIGDGPHRVWKNRLEGNALGVYHNTYNNTQTGYVDWVYPEFKGYYANVRRMTLETSAGPLTVMLEDPKLYVQVLRPVFPADPKPLSPTTMATRTASANGPLSANAWSNMPQADFSLLHAISPMGNKFNLPYVLGPESEQTKAEGTYSGTATFTFGK